MANNDRVSELYHGAILTADSQRICRERIHWMCNQTHGETVLDIGCSQGIATILAAREGHRVVGVDVEEPAIRYAEERLAEEHAHVRERIQLVHGDIFSATLDIDKFDTVLLGEIIEHQTNPRRLVERACTLLAPGGVLVVTTPFGLHVHDDHKSTLYLSDFVHAIDGLCSPDTLAIVDGYIRFTGRHLDTEGTLPAWNELLVVSEAGFLAKEWSAHGTLADRARRIKRLSKKSDEAETRANELEREISALSEKLRRDRTLIEELVRTRKELERQLAATKKRLSSSQPPEAGARNKPSGNKLTKPPSAQASAAARGVSALRGSIRREIDSGRLKREPLTAARKTYARVRRAVLKLPPPGTSRATPQRESARSGKRERKDTEPELEPYEPALAPRRENLTIATILDTFSEHCFQYEAMLIRLTRDGWRQQMEKHRPDFLFAESAWRGNGGEWKYLMTKYSERDLNPLRDLLHWCRDHHVPRVFWNKEDPANFEVFKDVARDFDHVFTTDANCVPRYRELLGHERVYVLPFAAQPAIHNPIQDRVHRRDEICFAGSWRADKYPERAEDTEVLLKPAAELGLTIYDRFHGTKDAAKFAFPEPYRACVRGSLDYDRMLTAYRSFNSFLNVNSVKNSPTMFSRRVFELLACGTPVVSSDSEGIRAMFGSLVKIASSSDEAHSQLARLLDDTSYRNRFAHVGYRNVLESHTYRHRLHEIVRHVGLANGEARAPLVSVLAATNRPERIENLLANVRRQTHAEIDLVVLLNSDRFDRTAVEEAARDLARVRVFQLPEAYTLADCLNHGVDHAQGAFVAKLDDDDFYGPHYLSDLLLATQFTDAAIIGKRTYHCFVTGSDAMALRFPGYEHQHVKFVHGATMLIRREVFDQVRFTPVRQGTDTIFQTACREAGMRIYSADPYNFIHVRHADVSQHTWQIDDESFLAKCTILGTGLDMGAVMI